MIRPGFPVRWHLGVLSVVLTAPMLLFVGIVLWEAAQLEQRKLEDSAQQAARHAAELLRRDLDNLGTVALLASTLVAERAAGSRERLPAAVEAVRPRVPQDLLVHDQAGTLLAGAGATATGEAAAPLPLPPPGQDVHVSGVLRMPGSAIWEVLVRVPLSLGGESGLHLALRVPASHFRELITSRTLPPNSGLSLADGEGRLIARWRDHDQFVGSVIAPEALARLQASDEGMWTGRNLNGENVQVAHARVQPSGWAVGAGILRDELNEPTQRALLSLSGLGLALVLAAAAATLTITRRLGRAIASLTAMAGAVGREEAVAPLQSGVSEVDEVGAVLERASADLRERRTALHNVLSELAGLLENAPIGVALLDRNLRYLRINPYLASINGLPVEAHIGRHVFELLPDLRGPLAPLFKEVLTTGKPIVNMEVTGAAPADPDRKLYWRAHYYPLRDEEGAIVAVGIIADDITERRMAEAALAVRTAELEVVPATVPAGVWFTYDREVRQVKRNAFAAKLMRVPPSPADQSSLAAQDGPGPANRRIRLVRDGKVLSEQDFPLQRAIRGEYVREEEVSFLFEDGTATPLLTTATALRDHRGDIIGAISVSLDISERKAAEEARNLLAREAHHRVKNTLATVQAIASATARTSRDVGAFTAAFTERLQSLSKTHTLLVDSAWHAAALREILAGELTPYDTTQGDRITLEGPDVVLPADLAVPVGLAIHELCTNAAKHGALSAPKGKLSVVWRLEGAGAERCLWLQWRESDGPPVTPPARRGFGSQLLERMMAAHGATVALDFRAEGLQYSLRLPIPADPELHR
jgi:PAS domain S-box-containing protein